MRRVHWTGELTVAELQRELTHMRGNMTRALVALVLAAGIGGGGLAASAASDGAATGQRVSAAVELPGWLDPDKDCPDTTAWGDALCPPRQY